MKIFQSTLVKIIWKFIVLQYSFDSPIEKYGLMFSAINSTYKLLRLLRLKTFRPIRKI